MEELTMKDAMEIIESLREYIEWVDDKVEELEQLVEKYESISGYSREEIMKVTNY